jgi:drug/metabolite transporter (DMT)-like permease
LLVLGVLPPLVELLLAIAAAVVASVMFGAAAVFQQRAIQMATGHAEAEATLSVRQLLALFRIPRWRTGLFLIAGGTALHVVALALAPLKVIQPIGVIAVPAAVILASAYAGRRPDARVVAGVAVSLLAVVAFVLLAATPDAPTARSDRSLTASVTVFVLSGVFFLLSWRARSWLRCLLLATAGAVNFGLGSALVRDLTQLLRAHQLLSDGWISVGLFGCMILAVGLGGWFIQQAYAAGAAAVVTACSTVVDPLVAVMFGVLVLGEGDSIDRSHASGMVVSALVATVGVCYLARHHPDHRLPDRDGAAVVVPADEA